MNTYYCFPSKVTEVVFYPVFLTESSLLLHGLFYCMVFRYLMLTFGFYPIFSVSIQKTVLISSFYSSHNLRNSGLHIKDLQIPFAYFYF